MRTFANMPHFARRTPSPQRREAVPRSVLHAPQRLSRASCPCGGTCPHCRGEDKNKALLQPKLTVNEPGDAYEREADRVADQVMRMPDPDLSIASAPPRLSRKCAACEEEERAQKLQTKPAGPAEPGASEAPPIVHEVLGSPGEPLDTATRAFMEPRFGYDFSYVSVHTDVRAAASSRAVNARAYTAARHLVFGEGQYQPDTSEGRRLLSHELAHVIQQGAAAPLDRSGRDVCGLAGARAVVQRQADRVVDLDQESGDWQTEADRVVDLDQESGDWQTEADRVVDLDQESGDWQTAAEFIAPPIPGVRPPSPPPPSPLASRIDVRDTEISGVPSFFRHIIIVHHDGATDQDFANRGGNTKGKPVCPGVGLKPGWGITPGNCTFNDPSLGAIGVGPLKEKFQPGATDWPAYNSRTLLMGPDADTKDACFAAEAARISAMCIPYSPCGPNSNSVAYTLLTNCGITAEKPTGLNVHPGWGILL